MAKRQMTAEESFGLRQMLHVAVIDALLASRRWEPGQIIFHGGTSLHLAHNSPRFSEDLDFMVGMPLRSVDIANAVRAKMGRPSWIPDDTAISIERARDGDSMRTFVVSLGGNSVMGKVKVKVEMWQTTPEALATIRTVITPVRMTNGIAPNVSPYVPTAAASEILADKIFAMGGRPYTKARDVFDIHWLVRQGTPKPEASAIAARFSIYDVGGPAQWLQTASARRDELLTDASVIADGIRPWLPSYWPLTDDTVHDMIAASIEMIDYGIGIVAGLAAADHDTPGMQP